MKPLPELATRVHSMSFRGVAMLPSRAAGGALERYFNRRFRTPDPWNYRSDVERRRIDAIARLVPADARSVLEIGCAEGHVTEAIVSRAPRAEIHCIDISATAAARTGCRLSGAGSVQVTVGDVRHWPFETLPEKLDVVLICDVLCYLGGPRQRETMVAKLRTHLADGPVILAHATPVARVTHHAVASELGVRVELEQLLPSTGDYTITVLKR